MPQRFKRHGDSPVADLHRWFVAGRLGALPPVAGLVSALLIGSTGISASQGTPDPAAPRVNWAKYQDTFADSSVPGGESAYLTDGAVDAASAWRSDSGTGGHWVGVTLPAAREIGSAQIFLGDDDTGAISNFSLNYDDGGGMQPLPGGSFTGNTATVLNVVFPAPVTMTSFMLYTSDASAVVREISLLPPNGGSGWPLGTDVSLDLARHRLVSATSTDNGNFAKLAVDGYAGPDVAWRTLDQNGPHSLTIELGATQRIGSAHFYSGSGGASAIANFRLQYWDDISGWLDVPGAVITGNTQQERVVDFTTPVATSRMLLLLPDNGQQTVRELALFAAASGIGSLPIGTSVIQTEPPTSNADDLGDRWWTLQNRHTGGTLSPSSDGTALSEARPFTGMAARQFQTLYNIASDTYRLRHRETGLCLEAQNAATAPGTPVVLGEYHAEPHQLWRIEPTSDGYGQYVNVWSGLVLETDAQTPAAVSLQTSGTDWRQQWQLMFQSNFEKKGLADYGWDWDQADVSWNYNWALDPFGALPDDVAFAPMQWGEGHIDSLGPRRGTWQTDGRPIALLGFNEPDYGSEAGGSDVAVATALDLWPQLESMDLPLVAPAPAEMYGTWINDFHGQAAARGYRLDYTGVHWYGPPDAAGLIAFLQGIHVNYGRPVWLTEFSTTDFAGEFDWSEEDNYRFLAEFLWMAEDNDWFKRYAIFPGYSEVPANPWDSTEPHCHIFDPDRNLTAVGELYAAWDGDQSVRTATPYLLHNKGSSLRLGNLSGAIHIDNIRRNDAAMQWAIVPAATAGRVHLVALADGRRLRWTGSQLEFASPATSGADVEWTSTHEANGYFFIDHPDTGLRLSLHRTNDANGAPTGIWYSMASNTTVDDTVRWRLIKPLLPEATSGLPSGWSSDEIGAPETPGYAYFDENLGMWVVGGSGADIYGSSDQFQFVARDFQGDGALIARVVDFTETDPFAKSGIMFRDGDGPDASFAHVFVGPSGVGFEVRAGGGTDVIGSGYDGGGTPRWLKLERDGDGFTAWHGTDGVTWTQVGGTQSIPLPATARAGLAVTAHLDVPEQVGGELNHSRFTHVSLVPLGWNARDVGAPGLPGSTTISNGGNDWAIHGSGSDIWSTSDQFQFASMEAAGDIEVVARVGNVEGTDPWAKAGVMLRASHDADAAFATVLVTPSNGVLFHWRNATGASATGEPPSTGTAPKWVKLVRANDTVLGYHSEDGASWSEIGSQQGIFGSADTQAGLVVTAHDDTVLNQSEFTNVSVTAVSPFDAWRHQHFTSADLANPSVSAALADANGDGVVNMLAYAAGLGPWTQATTENGARLDPFATAGAFTVRFTRNASATDLTLAIEGADDPGGSWDVLARSESGAPFTAVFPGVEVDESGDPDVPTVEIQDAYLTNDPSHPRRFVRLRAEQAGSP